MNIDNRIILSLIIPVTRDSLVLYLLSGISKQTVDLNSIEVILVCDRKETHFPNYPFNVKVLSSSSSHPGAKRNIGCYAAQGLYYAFLDDDCYPPPDWLRGGIDAVRQHNVVCGPCTSNDKSFLLRFPRVILSSFWGSGTNMYCNYRTEEVAFYNVGFANVFIHSPAWKEIQGCNEKANYLMDDKEFFYLLSLKKIKFYNYPSLEVSHRARRFPSEFLSYCFKTKFQTGINFFVYNEIFRKQPVFYFVYLSYFIIFILLIFSWKSLLVFMLFYYFFLAFEYRYYLSKDFLIYICLPLGIIFTNIAMLSGIFFGSLYFLCRLPSFKGEIAGKKIRMRMAMNES